MPRRGTAVEQSPGDLLQLAVPWWELALRCAVIFTAMLIGLRLFGKREVGQFRLSDLVLVLLIANAVQPAMTGPDNSLVGGLVIIGSLLAVNLAFSVFYEHVAPHWPALNRWLRGEPTVLVRDGQWLDDALTREGVDKDECEMSFREHGVESVEDVRLAVLERDGSISVVPRQDGDESRGKKSGRKRRPVRVVRRMF
jgi:uncharacterized membrane protein YcaP (DUF421 family)